MSLPQGLPRHSATAFTTAGLSFHFAATCRGQSRRVKEAPFSPRLRVCPLKEAATSAAVASLKNWPDIQSPHLAGQQRRAMPGQQRPMPSSARSLPRLGAIPLLLLWGMASSHMGHQCPSAKPPATLPLLRCGNTPDNPVADRLSHPQPDSFTHLVQDSGQLEAHRVLEADPEGGQFKGRGYAGTFSAGTDRAVPHAQAWASPWPINRIERLTVPK